VDCNVASHGTSRSTLSWTAWSNLRSRRTWPRWSLARWLQHSYVAIHQCWTGCQSLRRRRAGCGTLPCVLADKTTSPRAALSKGVGLGCWMDTPAVFNSVRRLSQQQPRLLPVAHPRPVVLLLRVPAQRLPAPLPLPPRVQHGQPALQRWMGIRPCPQHVWMRARLLETVLSLFCGSLRRSRSLGAHPALVALMRR